MTANIEIQESIDLPLGFQAAGVQAGIKVKSAKDVALLFSEAPATVAGTFTTNQVRAASVRLCQERIVSASGQAVIINSGNANACTGAQGRADAEQMAAVTADKLGITAHDVYVCSTGLIGIPMPMDIVESGIAAAAGALSTEGGLDAAAGIMTTDTRPKYGTIQLEIEGKPVTVSGLAKGSGMLHPKMATMLAFILTDAAVAPADLQDGLGAAVARSFNRISVDGDTSTNDTCLMLANGKAGNAPLTVSHPEWAHFTEAVDALCLHLAHMMVWDGEGATKFVTVRVRGAESDADADLAARSIANSIEVKASWNSKKVGWGRVMHALGYSSAKVIEEQVDVYYDDLQAAKEGQAAGTPDEAFAPVLDKPELDVTVDLNLGSGEAVIYACDATEEYIRLNTY